MSAIGAAPPAGIRDVGVGTINKSRIDEANSIVTKYSAFAFGGGVIPFPLMDVVAVSGIQLKMLGDLAKNYEIEFLENWGKSAISAVIGAAGPHALAAGIVGSLVKAIPVFGSTIGFATMPMLSAAATYAVGKVFIQHFESGGTFIDFDVASARVLFKEQFAVAKKMFAKRPPAVDEVANGFVRAPMQSVAKARAYLDKRVKGKQAKAPEAPAPVAEAASVDAPVPVKKPRAKRAKAAVPATRKFDPAAAVDGEAPVKTRRRRVAKPAASSI
ncbi:MAG: GTPase [Rhodospirillales bacterium]|nr:GTPase [Rhodospirillales bacterium]